MVVCLTQVVCGGLSQSQRSIKTISMAVRYFTEFQNIKDRFKVNSELICSTPRHWWRRIRIQCHDWAKGWMLQSPGRSSIIMVEALFSHIIAFPIQQKLNFLIYFPFQLGKRDAAWNGPENLQQVHLIPVKSDQGFELFHATWIWMNSSFLLWTQVPAAKPWPQRKRSGPPDSFGQVVKHILDFWFCKKPVPHLRIFPTGC